MEKATKVQVCIPFPAPDYSSDDHHCLFQEESEQEKWQELQQFWVDEKHRIQDFDNSQGRRCQKLSSSLERHLLFDECVQEPRDDDDEDVGLLVESSDVNKDEVDFPEDEQNKVVHGDEIDDIPTTYNVTGFKPNEFIVIGTYIDKRVIPGFKYRVRKNLTEKYLFGGKALRLETIGQGYGKRLTFECPLLNKNPNYFWSDSCAAGFGFTLQAVSPGDSFAIHEPTTGRYLGQASVTDLKGEQVEESTIWGPKGRIEKLIRVSFLCNVVLGDQGDQETISVNGVFASGLVSIIKKHQSAQAEVESIELTNFIVKGCTFFPEN